MTAELLNQYTESCRVAIKSSSAKLGKTFENLLLEIILLYVAIQRKINFTQTERYGTHCQPKHKNQLDFIYNALFASQNVAKMMMKAFVFHGFFQGNHGKHIHLKIIFQQMSEHTEPKVNWSYCQRTLWLAAESCVAIISNLTVVVMKP